MGKALAEADVVRIVELYEAGFSLGEIAALVFVSRQTALRYLQLRGVKMRPRGGWAYNKDRVSHADQDMTVFLYDNLGWTTNEVAEHLGISTSTVIHRLKRAGMPRRSRAESAKLRWERRGRKKAA